LIPLIELSVFSLGLSLLFATVHVFFRDIKWFYDSALMALFYATPIFYPPSVLGEGLQTYLKLNPLYHYFTAFRAPFMYGTLPDSSLLMTGGILAVVALILGILALIKADEHIINYL
jgi:lipopolysaccharide transport system permease protein